MCGITGIVTFKSRGLRDGDGDLIWRMTEALRHRGPDDTDVLIDGSVALGHRRLSIIDLSANGRQPMRNEDGRIHITYNGEVYNFRELKERYRLEERGHRFRSRTDSEAIVHLYEEIGLDILPELNGMFAFAIWDRNKRLVHLVRDRYGIKPLFFSLTADRLLFASEIKSILKSKDVPRRIHLQALHDYLSFDYIPGNQTAFCGIWEVPPGHVMSVSLDGASTLTRYWTPSFDADLSLSESTASVHARELMEQAVERQRVADVPVGVMLSGGLDSSAITAFMSLARSEPVHTYSVGFDDASYNELPYARLVAEQFGTVHREVIITADSVREMLPRYLTYIDEPYADGSAIPTYYVCQLAKQDVKVVLSGEGGDEAFAGYDTHAAYAASNLFAKIPRTLRGRVLEPLIRALPVSHRKLSLEFKLKRFISGQDLSPADAHMWWRIVLTEQQKNDLYVDRVLDEFEPLPSARFFRDIFRSSRARDDLNRILHIDSAVFLPDDLMIKNDRMSMAHSLEARVPLTDNDLTAFMERVPSSLKLKGLRKKNIMRLAMKGILPNRILNKKKVGLEMPYSKWFRKELKGELQKYCGPERIAETRLFRPAYVQRLIDEHLTGKADHGRALWGILNFMVWLEEYIPDTSSLSQSDSIRPQVMKEVIAVG